MIEGTLYQRCFDEEIRRWSSESAKPGTRAQRMRVCSTNYDAGQQSARWIIQTPPLHACWSILINRHGVMTLPATTPRWFRDMITQIQQRLCDRGELAEELRTGIASAALAPWAGSLRTEDWADLLRGDVVIQWVPGAGWSKVPRSS